MSNIEILGLTTTHLNLHGLQCVQYILTTRQGARVQEYAFIPEADKYRLQYYTAAENATEVKPRQPLTLQWKQRDLYLCTETEQYLLYNAATQQLTMPTQLFYDEEEMRPYRTAVIIAKHAEILLPLIAPNKTITYTSEWETLPAIIPEDIIVIVEKEFPIKDIVLRLPQRTNAIVLNPQLLG